MGMSTWPICSICGEFLWEIEEREAEMCNECQKKLEEDDNEKEYTI